MTSNSSNNCHENKEMSQIEKPLGETRILGPESDDDLEVTTAFYLENETTKKATKLKLSRVKIDENDGGLSGRQKPKYSLSFKEIARKCPFDTVQCSFLLYNDKEE